MNIRSLYAMTALISLGLCIFIALCMGTHAFIRGFLGDVIVVILIYFAVKTMVPIGSKRLALGVMLFAYAIEYMQFIDLLGTTAFRHNPLARIVLGSVFDPFDLLAYAMGSAFAHLMDKFIRLHIPTIIHTH